MDTRAVGEASVCDRMGRISLRSCVAQQSLHEPEELARVGESRAFEPKLPRALDPDLVGAVHEDVGDFRISHHGRKGAPAVHPIGELGDGALHRVVRYQRPEGQPAFANVEVGELVMSEHDFEKPLIHYLSSARESRRTP